MERTVGVISLFALCLGSPLSSHVSSKVPDFECGKTPVSPSEVDGVMKMNPIVAIVGGNDATPYSWPWQAELCIKSSLSDHSAPCYLQCGGSLISEQWVMTAAHCVYGYADKPERFEVKLGTFKFNSNKEKGGIVVNVTGVHRHPHYQHPHQFSNDIALLKLAHPVKFSDHIQPVCVAKSVENIVKEGKNAYVTGWGTKHENGEISTELRQVLVPFIDMKKCEEEYPGQIDETMECAGTEGHDACQGDSGGPLVTKHEKNKDWYQAGIVSWGRGCAEKGYAGVYSRVSAFCGFIEKTVGLSICRD